MPGEKSGSALLIDTLGRLEADVAKTYRSLGPVGEEVQGKWDRLWEVCSQAPVFVLCSCYAASNLARERFVGLSPQEAFIHASYHNKALVIFLKSAMEHLSSVIENLKGTHGLSGKLAEKCRQDIREQVDVIRDQRNIAIHPRTVASKADLVAGAHVWQRDKESEQILLDDARSFRAGRWEYVAESLEIMCDRLGRILVRVLDDLQVPRRPDE